MMRRVIAALVAALSAPAAAQQPMICHPLAEFEAALADKYRERLVGSGVRDDGIEVRVYAAPDGSWTLLLVRQGVGCAVSVGEAWTPLPRPQRGASWQID